MTIIYSLVLSTSSPSPPTCPVWSTYTPVHPLLTFPPTALSPPSFLTWTTAVVLSLGSRMKSWQTTDVWASPQIFRLSWYRVHLTGVIPSMARIRNHWPARSCLQIPLLTNDHTYMRIFVNTSHHHAPTIPLLKHFVLLASNLLVSFPPRWLTLPRL